jgi:type IV pilus assembly protein PilQ
MKLKNLFLVIVLSLVISQGVNSQSRDTRQRRGYTNPGEVVTFDSTMAFNLAIMALNELSRQYAGKNIIVAAREEITSQIGRPINALHWRDALDTVAYWKGFTVNERQEVLMLLPGGPPPQLPDGKVGRVFPSIDSRQILISTIVVGLDVSKLSEYGIDWRFSFLNPSPSRPVGVKDTTTLMGGLAAFGGADVNITRTLKGGSIDALLSFLASNKVGDVINSVKMIIPEGDSGSVQIGQDISIPTRSIGPSGEVAISSQLVPTGTVLKVRPYLLKAEDIEYVYLDFAFEQSSLVSGGELPVINKNSSKQTLVAIHGEEVSTSGYYTYNETNERVGIPILKDLPWWFLGLRYIFGSERTSVSKTQIIYLFKIEILPSLRERSALKKQESDLEMMRKRMDSEIEKLRSKKDKE